MKKLTALLMIFLVTACNSAADADTTLRSIHNICDHDSYRVSRTDEGEIVNLTITCQRNNRVD